MRLHVCPWLTLGPVRSSRVRLPSRDDSRPQGQEFVLKEGLHLLSLKPHQKPMTYILSKNKPVALQCWRPHLPSAVTLGWPFPVDSHQQDLQDAFFQVPTKNSSKGKSHPGRQDSKWREWCLCALNQAITGLDRFKKESTAQLNSEQEVPRGITWTPWSRQASLRCPGSSAAGRGLRPHGSCWTRCRRPALL